MPTEADGLASLSLTLTVVVVLLWAGLWAMRRMRPGMGLGNARDCAILRSLALGPRERLVVVRVGPRHLVIGIGSASVSLLCELDQPLPALGEDRFGEAVRKAVGRWRGG
ncbi:MAG: flagellar biosynthetic protein FliO [Alphaproteobacteria bacterium]|nr:flagellar biosynthetic protein FliO [Alphaproteobacteria bacterium]MBV9552028.1 flagellar biosynthetic protein FliO [Alphaproteobacteria bacterium]